jgi:hypothetical protein
MAFVALLGAGAVLAPSVPAGASGSSAQVTAQEAQAKRQLIVHSDFPAGWSTQGSVTTSDSNGDSANFPGGNQLIGCLGLSHYLANLATPTANSPTFSTKQGLDTVQETVNIFPSTKVAGEAKAVISSSKVPGCMTTAFQGPAKQSIAQSAGQGATVGTITVAVASPGHLVPHASGFTISVPITDHGVSLNTQVDIVSLFRGTSDNQFDFTSVGQPFPTSLERHLESVASGRS